jgi:hypothetical protein
VLFSRTLEEWSCGQREELRKRREEYNIFEPHSRIYDGALAAIERTAHRFREGAAVQKNMVLGVLGHGLLELLDEHLLELWEVAQALDPVRTWEQDQGSGKTSHEGRNSTAARFADYLLGRALNAETIPKNLRSLQGLLCYTAKEPAGEAEDGGPYDLQRLYQEFEDKERWRVPKNQWKDLSLDRREYHFLRLTLSELAQNDHCHGRLGQDDYEFPLVEAVEPGDPESGQAILIFRYPSSDEDYERLRMALEDSDSLQRMVPARTEPRFPSHGTGLYLANLAAAAVGWKLDFEKPVEKGRLKFRLHREPLKTAKKKGIDQ